MTTSAVNTQDSSSPTMLFSSCPFGFSSMSSVLVHSVTPSKKGEGIRSDPTDVCIQSYALRGYQYITASALLQKDGLKQNMCTDSGAQVSYINLTFLFKHLTAPRIWTLPSSLKVNSTGDKRLDASDFTNISFFFQGKDESGKPIVAIIEYKLHVVDELSAQPLLEVRILKPERIYAYFGNDTVKRDSCKQLSVSVGVVKRGERISKLIFS